MAVEKDKNTNGAETKGVASAQESPEMLTSIFLGQILRKQESPENQKSVFRGKVWLSFGGRWEKYRGAMKKNEESFYGRETELMELDELWGKPGASLVICRGRQRIGKSTLVEQFAKRSRCRFLKFEGKAPEAGQRNQDQLDEFCRAARKRDRKMLTEESFRRRLTGSIPDKEKRTT